MEYPEALLIPVFMLADYFLTLAGAVQKEKKYSQYFQLLHYELNPAWQKDVSQRKWFNLRYILITALVSSVLIGLLESDLFPETLCQSILGFFLVLYATINGRHVSNLLTFYYVNRHPHGLAGQIKLEHGLALSLSLYQHLAIVLPLLVLVIFSNTPFASGGLIGACSVLIMHLGWLRKYRKQAAAAKSSRRQA